MTPAASDTQLYPGAWLATHAAVNGRADALLLRTEPGGIPPTLAEDHTCKVVFDGVLYNRPELIELLGGTAASDDAALVGRAYARWGEGLLRKLKGIFALIIWDRERETFLCARDPLGIYPLFYTDTGGELLLSTSVDSLVRHPAVSPAVNRAALADHLLHRWFDCQETFYEKVRRLPPGHALQLDRSGRRLYRYWDPVPPGAPLNWVRGEELEQFDELFAQAVRRCLAFGPGAIYLSGGLDSVSVAAVAAEQSRGMSLPPPWALSLDFPEPDQSETAIQRQVAADLGLPQDLVPFEEAVGPQGLLRAALELSSRWPAPLLNAWGPAYLHLGLRAGRHGRRVILTGMGGDEWLGVGPMLAADLMRGLDLKGLYRLWDTERRSYRLSGLLLFRNLFWRSGARPLLRAGVLRAPGGRALQRAFSSLRSHSWGALPDWIAPDPKLRKELDRRAREARPPRRRVGSFYLHDMRIALDHPVPSWEMEEFFVNAHRLRLWLLHPFLDPDLVDFLYRTPPQFLNLGGRTKSLVRQALRRTFPGLGFESQKKDVTSNFFRSCMLKQGARAVAWLGGPRALAEAGIADGPRASSLIQTILANGQMQQSYRIWDILNLEAWLAPRS